MRLLHFIEQHHRIGPAPHRLGELATFLVTHVARRCPDQAGHGIALHELAHVEPHQRLFFIKEVRGQGAGQLGFTHTGGAQEQKGAHGPPRIFHASAGAANRRCHSSNGIGLAEHLLAEAVFQFQQLLALTSHQALHRDAGGAGDHIGNVLGRYQVPQQAAGLLQLHLQLLTATLHVLLQLHLQPRHVFPLRETLGLGDAVAQLLLTLLQLTQILKLLTLVLPAVLQLLKLVEGVAAALLMLHPLLHGRLLSGQQRAFDAAQFGLGRFHHRRLGGGLHLQISGRFINQIDRLIGQATVADVAICQSHRRLEGVIANADAVVQLVALAHTTQDLQRHIQGWFLDHQLLEAPVQHGIFLQRAAVFLDGGGPNAAQLTSGQGWFEHAAGIGARTITVHQGVDFIDEQHHPFTAFIAGGDLLQNAA